MVALMATMGVASSAWADNLLEVMDNDGGFKTLLSAIKIAGMQDEFKSAGPLTVFAPTDLAFAAMPKEKLDALFADKAALKKVISLHVVPAKVTKDDVDAGKVKTLEGDDVTLSVAGGIKIDDIPCVGLGINADNGVIHALTGILKPKS
jgi:uncharacterized surface protein with fasciclin (FAS1) repeats